jgi:arabinan endo-1,5-alpha-L-arabinosidase
MWKAFSFVSTVTLAIIFSAEVIYSKPLASNQPRVIRVAGDVGGVHDPSIIKEGKTWYLFGTATETKRDGELPVRCSHDLHQWTRCGYVLPGIPRWIQKECPDTKELWAPDISYFDGQHHLYYAFSAYGKNSGIALLTNQTLDPRSSHFRWVDQGVVLRSNANDDFNAIDPNLLLDQTGQAWLVYGSFWSGIKIRKLDRKTGKLSIEDTRVGSLASRKRPDSFVLAPRVSRPPGKPLRHPLSFIMLATIIFSSPSTCAAVGLRVLTGPWSDVPGL